MNGPPPRASAAAQGQAAPAAGRAAVAIEESPRPAPTVSQAEPAVQSLAPLSFIDIVALANAQGDLILRTNLARHVHLVHFEPGRIEFRPGPQAPTNLANRLGARLTEWTGRRWVVSVSSEAGAPSLEQQAQAAIDAEREAAERHPLVQAALAAFPGSVVEAVRELLPPAGPTAAGESEAGEPEAGEQEPAPEQDSGNRGSMKNLGQLMKQAQAMQSRMAEMQAELERVEMTGQAGGGMVKVILNGKGEMRGLKIDPKLADPAEIEVLEDLIIAAAKDAKSKVDEHTATEMGKLTGGLPLPLA